MREAQPSLPVGLAVGGRYLVEDALGRGGMAVVYRVRDARTGQVYALKRGSAGNLEKQKRHEALLAREYHMLCELSHPCIIEVFDYGVDEHGPYYVMELLAGSDLGASGKLPWPEVCAVLCDVGSSLAMLHARGLLHRDVSTRNVHCAPGKRAKLIDFGAVTSIGVQKEIVGTPPFMAPEVMQMQALDERADLFSLGALGYRLLTGRHAYPARHKRELRDVWRSRPAPPSSREAEVPGALSELILQLLALDRNARPQSASEVISRLCAIAGLPLEEQVGVSQSYLTAPTLVGRVDALVAVRTHLLALGRGDGGALLIEGASGSGRSRLLDACAVEAKLLGAMVVRADAADSAHGDFGVLRSIGNQLLRLMPKEAADAARLARNLLSGVLDELPDESSGTTSVLLPERERMVRELRDFVLAVSAKQRLLIAVDDFDRIDEPSMAVLAALAYKAERHPLILALTIDRERNTATSPAQRLLRSVCEPIALERLSAVESEALMRSVFGNVPNLGFIAGRIYQLAEGDPRTSMALAQHLVTSGLVQYRAGGFALPERLSDDDLPKTFLDVLAQRLGRLSPDARELCDVVCVTDADAPTVTNYAQLTSHGDGRRVFSALDELVAARVFLVETERYRFSQRGFFFATAASASKPAVEAIHARVARWLGLTGGDVLRRAHHLLESESGVEFEAVQLILSTDLSENHAPLALLERALACAQRRGMNVLTCARLRMALVVEAQAVWDVARFRSHVPALLSRLDHDSGLALYRALEHVPVAERLGQALAKTHEAHLAAPEAERGYPVTQAIPELARLASLFHAVGLSSFDIDTWTQLPSLAPLVPLSPALGVVERFGAASRAWVQGRFTRSVEIYRELLERVEQPDRAGLQDPVYARVRLGLHLLLGLSCAVNGMEQAEVHAKILEADRRLRVSAWRVRQALQLTRGDTVEAQRCMRRAEALQLQVGGEQQALGATFGIELSTLARMGDVTGLRVAIERVARIACEMPCWQLVLLYGRVRLRQVQGDAEGALAELLASLDPGAAGRHAYFTGLAACHVSLLNDLGRSREACSVGRGYLALCEREELSSGSFGAELALALAFALVREGAHAEGVALADRTLAELQREGANILSRGTGYETRARMALAMLDAPAFEHFAELCGREYTRGKNPVLAARFARLLDAARALPNIAGTPMPELDAIASEYSDGDYATLESRMQECADPADRARCALTILLQHLESFAGYLYAVQTDGLCLLCGLPDDAPEAELDAWLRRFVAAEIEAYAADADSTGESEPDSRLEVPARFIDGSARRFRPTLLYMHEPERSLIAVVASQVEGNERAAQRELLTRLAIELFEHGELEGVSLPEAGTRTGD